MAELISRIYSNFRGVDFRGEEINLVRSPGSKNVWKDYKETDSIKTRPSLEMKYPCEQSVCGIYEYNNSILIHAGSTLLKRTGAEETVLFSDMLAKPSQAFVFDNVFYIKDGKNYLKYDGSTIEEVVGYVPTTTISRKPMGGGTKYEDVNMLSDYRKNSFLADGGSFSFFLDVMNIDEDFVPKVWLDDELVAESEYAVDYKEGKITFRYNAPDAPPTDGQDNIEIEFKKSVVDQNGNKKYRNAILECTLLQVFDNRVFFSGNPEYPNMVWHCSLNDPSYVSDLDYYNEGMDNAQVKGLVAGNNALWVFREPSHSNTTVFYHTPSIDDEYGKIYPSAHSSITTGCVGKAINFNDDIVFFSERGMEGISGDVTTEQVVAHRSSLVDRRLTAENNYEKMVLVEWEGYLLVCFDTSVYLADSRAMFTNENHMEYEWFYWDMEEPVLCATVIKGVLYIGSRFGVYTLTGKADLESWWTTPKDKFKNPHKRKTTNKKGCIVEAWGEVTVCAKTNEDDSFIPIGTYSNVVDAFTCRIKKKKWKDIQLAFYSTKRFRLESVTLEAYIGAYLKNLN